MLHRSIIPSSCGAPGSVYSSLHGGNNETVKGTKARLCCTPCTWVGFHFTLGLGSPRAAIFRTSGQRHGISFLHVIRFWFAGMDAHNFSVFSALIVEFFSFRLKNLSGQGERATNLYPLACVCHLSVYTYTAADDAG